MTSTEKNCWICGAADVRQTTKFNDWNVYRCVKCSFRFAADGAPLVFDEHYDESYFIPLMKRDETGKWERIYSGRLAYLKQHAPSNRLLEAGAGASTFALAAAAEGFRVDVADAAPWAVKYLSGHEGVSGNVVDLNDCRFAPAAYGAIHCSHVLEHLRNPRKFLSECLNALQPDGLMYLSFPAYEPLILACKDWLHRLGVVNHPYNYQAPDHLSYFSAKCIRQTVEDVGFEVVKFSRRKFISLYDSADRIRSGGAVRRLAGGLVSLTSPLTRRIGFHRDLEIILKRPSQKAAAAA